MRSVPMLVLLVVLTAACGSNDAATTASDPEPSTNPSPTSPPPASPSPTSVEPGREPACETTWVDGNTIPRGYEGCSEGQTWVPAATTSCESGQVIVTYGDSFYGAVGNRVNEVDGPLTTNKQFQRASRSCG